MVVVVVLLLMMMMMMLAGCAVLSLRGVCCCRSRQSTAPGSLPAIALRAPLAMSGVQWIAAVLGCSWDVPGMFIFV